MPSCRFWSHMNYIPQVNDLVRRKKEFLLNSGWPHGEDPVTITKVSENQHMIYVNNAYITWEACRFDLLYRPKEKLMRIGAADITFKDPPNPLFFSNAAEKQSDGKTPFDILFSLPGLKEVAEVFGIGAKKYPDKDGDYNWRASKKMDKAGQYQYKKKLIGACLRHAFQYINGETYDKETGKHHLAHAITNLLMVHDLEQ
jgi:hypothetical protein